MTVSELIEQLQEYPPDALVCVYATAKRAYNSVDYVTGSDKSVQIGGKDMGSIVVIVTAPDKAYK